MFLLLTSSLGFLPSEFFSFLLAPHLSKISAIAALSLSTDIWSGVFCHRLARSRLAPLTTREPTTLLCPLSTARCKALWPVSVCTFGSAPLFRRSLTMETFPLSAARHRAVSDRFAFLLTSLPALISSWTAFSESFWLAKCNGVHPSSSWMLRSAPHNISWRSNDTLLLWNVRTRYNI